MSNMPSNGPIIGRYEIRRLWRKVRPFAAYNLETDAYVMGARGCWGVSTFENAVRWACRQQKLPVPADIEALRDQLPPFHGNEP